MDANIPLTPTAGGSLDLLAATNFTSSANSTARLLPSGGNNDSLGLGPADAGGPLLPALTYVFVTVTVIDALVFVTGVVGNVLVLVVIFGQAEMRTATNMFLANLSTADLLVLLVCMPSALLELHSRDAWYLGRVMCKLVPLVENAVAHTSVLTIVAISFERYYAICCPLEVLYTCTKRRALKIITVLWAAGVGSALPFTFMAYTVPETRVDTGELITVCVQPVNSLWKVLYVVTMVVLLFLVPIGLLTCLYISIGQHLVKETGGHKQPRRTMKSRQQVINMLITIIILFFVCLLPIRTLTLWLIFTPVQYVHDDLGLEGYLNLMWFARIMFYINSAGNPILYNVMSTKFREACRKFLGLGSGMYIESARSSINRPLKTVADHCSSDGDLKMKVVQSNSGVPLLETAGSRNTTVTV